MFSSLNHSSVIQGTADVTGKLSQEEVSNTVEFCLNAFEHHAPEKQAAVMKKMEMGMLASNASNVAAPANVADSKTEAAVEEKAVVDPEGLSPDEMKILNTIRARQMLRREDTLSIDNFTNDAINGYIPVVARGDLGLEKVVPKSVPVPKDSAMDEPTGPLPTAMDELTVPLPPAMDELAGPLPPAIKV